MVGGGSAFNGVKVFSATTSSTRAVLGERVDAWIRAHTEARVVDVVTTQSSDDAFHCVTITVFFEERVPA